MELEKPSPIGVRLGTGALVEVDRGRFRSFCAEYDATHPDAADNPDRWDEAVDAFIRAVRANPARFASPTGEPHV